MLRRNTIVFVPAALRGVAHEKMNDLGSGGVDIDHDGEGRSHRLCLYRR